MTEYTCYYTVWTYHKRIFEEKKQLFSPKKRISISNGLKAARVLAQREKGQPGSLYIHTEAGEQRLNEDRGWGKEARGGQRMVIRG